MSRVVRALALLAVSASALSAQVQVKSFAVITRLGAATPERAASLNSGGLIGLDAEYAFTKWFGLGTSVEVMRNNTHREDFLTRLRYGNSSTGGGDSIYYQNIGQAISTINVGAYGLLRLPNEKISPFLMAGVGNYTMIADAQVNGKTARQNDLSLSFGGGIWLKLADRVGVQLDARAMQYHGFDREFFNPARGRREQLTPFPEDFPTPPPEKATPMSTTFTLGFRYLPGGGGNEPMLSMRHLLYGALGASLVVAGGCEDNRSITSEHVGDLGFGINLGVQSTNMPRGTVRFPTSIIASATPDRDSVIVTLAGLDSLTTGTYTMWFANDSATKFVRVTNFNMTITRVDTTLNAAGDPVAITTTTQRAGQSGFRTGGSNFRFRLATARNAATGMPATDSLNLALISIEAAAPGATPGEVRSIWGRRGQAVNLITGVRFGAFNRGVPTVANAGSPTATQEFAFTISDTNGVAVTANRIVPRGRVEVRGKIMVVNDSNYYRPPVGYYYNAWAIKFDTISRYVDTVYIGRRTSPLPARNPLYEADKTNPSPDVVFDSPMVIFAMTSRVSTDTIPDANSTPPWKDFGIVRVNLQSKYSQEGRMGPNTVLQAIMPPSILGR